MREWFGALALVVVLGGCVTSYQPKGLSGGFSEQQIAKDTFIVSASGNAYTSMDVVQTMSLRRAAELALNNGYKYFAIVDGSQDYKTGTITSPGTYTSTTSGSAYSTGGSAYGSTTTYGTYSPGVTTSFRKPRTSITVKLLNDNSENIPNLHDAAEVMTFTSNLVK